MDLLNDLKYRDSVKIYENLNNLIKTLEYLNDNRLISSICKSTL